ncbi:hypothetical protein L3Y34_002921 [Caenorhabditis briggsae]|uniref:Uncharacterized protein n=1 Tax=Caenorhabditis briggsae TaxID=6238 RepID=A0AAE9AAZ4_CAEBR|nr:hypothetical protein L3Y34_002921 [Caenorhabditis briggsae]
MKVLLVAGILLCCARIAAPAALNRKKRDEIDEEKVVENVNKLRRELAKGLKISNMHKVEYDDGLEVPDLCKEPPQKVKDKMEELKNEKSEQRLMEFFDTLEDLTVLSCLSPAKTTVACLRKTCKDTNVSGANCVCGGGNGSMKKGEPGSECDGEEDDGLCENSGSNLFTIGTILNLIAFYLVASFL